MVFLSVPVNQRFSQNIADVDGLAYDVDGLAYVFRLGSKSKQIKEQGYCCCKLVHNHGVMRSLVLRMLQRAP
jgi:hypothetical protein